VPRLARSFFAHGAAEAARRLVGHVLERELDGTLRRARIVETEAYVGPDDLASHARFGRTGRNAVMWGPPGHAYVYFVYGMHHMLNVVAAPEGNPQAVLLRAAEPLDGWDARLTGPGLLARGFQVSRADDGADLVAGPWGIARGRPPPEVAATPRIGIDFADTWRDAPLRFIGPGSPALSRRPAGRAPGAA
jgi:DNA-3-methyladenine glycosylase